MNCDLCNKEISFGSKRFSALEIKAAFGAGLSEMLPLVSLFESLPQEIRSRWIQKVENGSQDWALCSGCSSVVESALKRASSDAIKITDHSPDRTVSSEESATRSVSSEIISSNGDEQKTEEAAPRKRADSIKLNPSYPGETGRVAAMPESRLKWLSAIVGIALGVITSIAIGLLAAEDSMLAHMFNLRSLQTAIPMAISSLFFWAIVLCILRWRRLMELERISNKSLLIDAVLYLKSEGVEELSKEMENEECQASPLLRRLQSVVRQWRIRPSLQDADLVLQQHVVNDEESVHSGYNLIRTFIWALPVLGLIGTVLGIAVAVGGFAQFLGGDIEEIAEIKKNLVAVTGGLSFAFLITLQGLLTALLVMLAASALQSREEKFYASIGQDIADVFLPALQEVAPETTAPVVQTQQAMDGEGLQALRETLKEIAAAASRAIQENSRQLIKEIAEREKAFQVEIAKSAESFNLVLTRGAEQFGGVFNQAGKEFADAGDEFHSRMVSVCEDLKRQSINLGEAIERQVQASSEQHSQMIAVVGEQTKNMHSAKDALFSLTETTKAALASQEALQNALSKLGESNLEETFIRLTDAMSHQARETQSMSQSLTKATQEMLASQAVLQSAVNQLHELGFAQTMSSIRDSMLSLSPILASFREPFVLQAVPAKYDGAKG